MTKRIILTIACCLCAFMLVAKDFVQYVDPQIGSEGLGRTFPGPSMPYGMAKPGPDGVTMPNAGWAPMPEPIKGFSQMHVSGTGGGQKYGNILIQPFDAKNVKHAAAKNLDATTSKVLLPNGKVATIPCYAQERAVEHISLGYYTCIYKNGIQTEVTTAERCAYYRFSYHQQKPSLLIDAASFLGMDTIPDKRETQQYVDSHIEQVDAHTLRGWSTVRGGWNNGGPYTVYFYLQSDVPFTDVDIHDNLYAIAHLSKDKAYQGTVLVANVKIGISHVSMEKAEENLQQTADRDFDAQVSTLKKAWNEKLGKIEIEGTDEQKRMFYTGIYHTMLMPVDKSGENPHFSATPYYDDYYAIWDTYRTSMPLLTLIDEDRQRDMVNSLLNIYQHDGYLPDARSGNWNGRTQGGSNAEIVLADAFAKKMKGIDYELALQAMVKDAEVRPTDKDPYFGSLADEKHGRGGIHEYNTLGYIPYGIDRAGNRTVEYSYDDWCIAQVAKGLNHPDLYEKYMKRSQNWRNLWRSDYEWQGMRGFIMPRSADGRWLDSVPWGKSKVYQPLIPYKPDTKVAPWYLPWWSTFFYEALSAEYSLSIPHDVPGLIEACGGKEAFIKRLDTFFANKHYNVANEPSFLTPYLYHWAGRPDLSVARIHHILHTEYHDTPDGLPGNDDSGAMSSWLVFNMMGIYPVAGQNLYIVGSPTIPSYTIHLSNGKKLKVKRGEQAMVANSQEDIKDKWGKFFLSHELLTDGGKLSLPHYKTVDDDVDKASKSLGNKDKQRYSQNSQLVDNYLKTIPTQWISHFVLNRQYRNWQVGVDISNPDTLLLKCNESVYLIPRSQVEKGTGFCWDSPQKGKNLYVCDRQNNHGISDGTFLFISKQALETLLQTGKFVYNGITWQQISKDEKSITVKADVDDTLMQIALHQKLPWVLRMENNPLGIDWILCPTTD